MDRRSPGYRVRADIPPRGSGAGVATGLDRGYPDEKGSLHAMLAAQLRKLGRTEDASRATAQAIRLADAFAQQNENPPALAPQH